MLSVISRTPFRVSFFGGGTDHPAWFRDHGGAVLSMAIDKYCYVGSGFLPSFFNARHRIVWSHIEAVHSVNEILHPTVKGGLKAMGFDDSQGIEIFHHGDLPTRSGIGSSSAFAVGLIKVLSAMRGVELDARALTEKAIELEQNTLQENVGCHDQVAGAYGGLNFIEFRRNGSFDVTPLKLKEAKRDEFEKWLMLFYTGSNRVGFELAKRVIRNLDENAPKMIQLHNMAAQSVEFLQTGKIEDFGRLLHEDWMLRRGLADGISTALIDRAYEDARRAGALGGKLLGVGGAGFMVFVVPPGHQPTVRESLAGLTFVPIRIALGGSSVIYRRNEFIGAR
jgi:D-glycero-alpha-D-manno-heptose-7-phosphate kinase